MQKIFSKSLKAEEFSFLAQKISKTFDADLFLSSPGFEHENKSFIGVTPKSELIVEEKTKKSDIRLN